MDDRHEIHLHPVLILGWKMNKLYEKICSNARIAFQLTQNEADVLLFLTNNKGVNTAMDIARYRSISKALVSKSIDSLTARGFLVTEKDPDDRRFTRLYITPEAQDAVSTLIQAQSGFAKLLEEDLTAQELETLSAIVQKFTHKVDQYLKEQTL